MEVKSKENKKNVQHKPKKPKNSCTDSASFLSLRRDLLEFTSRDKLSSAFSPGGHPSVSPSREHVVTNHSTSALLPLAAQTQPGNECPLLGSQGTFAGLAGAVCSLASPRMAHL